MESISYSNAILYARLPKNCIRNIDNIRTIKKQNLKEKMYQK